MWQALFDITNAIALIGWALLILLPRRESVIYTILYGAIGVGWTHYLALDLLAGLWIARDADRLGAGRLLQVPYLLATFMAGPAGVFAWLVTRQFIGGDKAAR